MERRAVAAFEPVGNRLTGYAAVFDQPSQDLGGFREYVRKGAFSRSLASDTDVLALVHHRPELILGRTGAGTLQLREDDRGLRYEIELPDTSYGRDLRVAVERGDVAGASFAFTVPKGGDHWFERSGKAARELLEVRLHDVTITPTPAYPDTSVARRSLPCYRWRLQVARRFLETV